ncbi:MAG: serine/threonine protein kinase [Deltaproteobacteria bacterium]|nr:serine/threonine protein kinase [Deltaproteobacteria bacterium]
MSRRPDNLPAGTIVGDRYRVEAPLGEGGMGRVYQATQLNLGRRVALKVLLPGIFESSSGVDRFMREARVAAVLHHPCAVEIYDVGVDENLVFIAMELLSGAVLRSLMAEGVPMPLGDAVELAAQLADLLVATHAISLVHRDLKPENIFVEPPLRARVVDFGLAFIDGGAELGRMTREGLVVGTPAYLAPEQAQGLHVGPPADIYAFGCVLYELVTGVPPFRGSQVNVLTQHLYVAPTRPRERAPEVGIPGELDELVVQMMAKREADRPVASDVLAQLSLVRRTLTGERHRGRDALPLQGRAARMVSVKPVQQTLTDGELPLTIELPRDGVRLAIVGRLTHEETLSLASNGIEPIALDDGVDPRAELIDVVLAIGQPPERLARLTATGVPVVATTLAGEVDQPAALLRLGVREVLVLPIRIDDLARKVRRLFDRAGREQRS